MIARLRGRVFYGWWMVGATFGMQFLTSGLLNQSFGAYVVLLREDFGWSRTTLSLAYSLQQVQFGLLGPVQGLIMDRFGIRGMMRVGIVILGAGFMLLSQVHSLAAFYGVFLFMSLGSALSGFFPSTVAIVNWFELQRARAISTMTIGFALGGVVVPVVSFCLENLGWRHTALASGILILAAGLPLTQVIRGRPEEYGDYVDGIPPVATADDGSPTGPSERRDFTFREAVHTRAFWLIAFGHASALLVVSAVNVHLISHLEDGLGYSLATASLIYTLMTVMQVFGMVLGGLLGDRTDNSLLATICMGMHLSGLLLVAYAFNFPMVVGFAVLHGLAWGIRGPLMQAIRADYFGRSSFGMIMGVSQLFITAGTISGPLIVGSIADQTGSYKVGFTIVAIAAGLGSAFFILAKKPERPLNEAALGAGARTVEAL